MNSFLNFSYSEWTTTLLFHLRPFLLLSLLPFDKTHITKDSVTVQIVAKNVLGIVTVFWLPMGYK